MADAVTSQTLVDTEKRVVMKFTNLSDGNGESAVKKVDVSALTASPSGAECARVHITQVWYVISGMRIDLEWDASSNVKALILGGGVTLNLQLDILILDLSAELKIMLVHLMVILTLQLVDILI